MTAPDPNGSRGLGFAHQLVEGQRRFVAFAVAQPADTRRQPLEMYFLAGQRDPTFQRRILREEFENSLVGAIDIFGIPCERYPAKGAFATAKEWANIGRDESRKIQGVRLASR